MSPVGPWHTATVSARRGAAEARGDTEGQKRRSVAANYAAPVVTERLVAGTKSLILRSRRCPPDQRETTSTTRSISASAQRFLAGRAQIPTARRGRKLGCRPSHDIFPVALLENN